MADSTPICDVLSEAMEYLSKLGTNIRLRSKNLKDKRIRKDKLTNTHAIHKAVEKVLLICDLSKKSIQNVETGVKNLLSQMEKSGSTFGPGPRTRERDPSQSEVEFEHFTYESRILKIRDKISVGHFTSVKVVSTAMTLSMIEKYPVYYNCQLYRMRKRKKRSSSNASISECDNTDIQDRNEIENNCIKDATDSKDRSSSETDNQIESKNNLESKHTKSVETPIENIERLQQSSARRKSDGIEIEMNEQVAVNKTTESDSVVEVNPPPDQIKDESDCESKPKKRKFNEKAKKFRHIKVFSSSDSDDEKNIENASPCAKTQKNDTTNKESCDKAEDNQDNSKTSEISDTNPANKPLIKCVSLSKLLKPDRIGNLEKTDESQKSIDVGRPSRKQRCSKSQSRKEDKSKIADKILEISDTSEDENVYWSHKRKEVKNFKPKEFNINIQQLPKITLTFLEKHNLEKVTQMGSVICEVIDDTSKKKSTVKKNMAASTKISGSEKDSLDIVDIHKVKNALLYDSDSEGAETCQSNQSNIDNENQETASYSEKQNEKDCESHFDNIRNETQTSINEKNDELECQSSDDMNVPMKETEVLNESDNVLSKEQSLNKETLKQNAEEGENPSFEIKVDEEKQEKNNESDTGKKKSIKAHKNVKKFYSEKSNHKAKKSHKTKTVLENMNEVQSKVKNALLEESDSGQKSNNEQEKSVLKKSLLEDSDSQSQNEESMVETSDKVKKSLLNESNSDSNNETVQEVTNNVKNFLLAESDCESQNFAESEKKQDCDKLKKILLNESDSEENNSPEKNTKIAQNQNSSLHESDSKIVENKSSDDSPKNLKKRRRYSSNSPPQSKRKNMMESMYAKKMLLRYSSSSDTEDEQLRTTFKEIKDNLLNGMSSDDDVDKSTKSSAEKEDQNVADAMLKNNSSSEADTEVNDLKAVKSEHSDSDSKDTSSKEPICGNAADNSTEPKMDRSSATSDGSCCQNTDIEDDKEIDGLTNLKSLEKTHRRRKSWTKQARRRKSVRRTMAKASGLISNEGFLDAESSSDAPSLSGSEHADNADLEDMPRVKMPEINGDGIGHLAKDDLLGESDTSVSHDEKKSYKKEEDSDDDNVKSKRRKMIAISSDSEAGSSRKKDHNMRLSDFEDSEDENSEPVKNKRKKVVDSDASAGSSDDAQKKRRRIKTLDESDVSGSDTENEGRNKHGRKNIRKVMSKNQLEEATKKAAREEKERIARISERQKLYNNLEFDESGKPDEVTLEKVVLDFDPETKEPLIQVDRGLVKKLKPHQANGIKFMWDACFESVKRIKKDKGSGCILAHCMGLGKTLQVVSLTHTLLTHGTLTGVSRVLVVCPLSTVLNWVNEFRMWLKHAEADFEVDVYELSKFKQNSERAFQLSQWYEHGGVCVLGYEMFRNLSADKGKKFKKKILKNFQESLVDPGPDLVVCDEGHLLKNEKTSLSQSMNRVKTRRRIVLTGTPLQNNLKEYYCMVQFVKPNLLGKYNEYLNRFVNPITNGQYTDSTEHDIRVMKRRSHVLHKMLDGAVQRRDYGVLAPFLPPKHEYVLFITLTDVQIKLYHHYLDNYSRRPQPGKSSGFLFPDFQSLQRIWTHPLVLKYNSERYEIMQQKKREREEEDSEGSLVDFIDDDSTPDESSTEESSDDSSDLSDDSRKKSKKKKSAKKGKGKDSKASSRRGTRANPIELDDDEPIESLEVKSENPTEWWMKLVSEEELEDMRNSHKLILLFDILRQCEAIGDKLLVFSQSLYSLDLIEHFLGKVDEATQAGRVDEKLGGHVGSWSPGVDYFRLDGSTSCENRSIWCKNFNRIDNQRARLFLISTRAGGLGINLVAANRVVIFDVSWNPSHDVQSIFRVYRFGQKKPCYVYRFLAMGTMEEKIYERQVTKQAISKRVIDEQQIDRHYAENDLAELYKFEPTPPVPRPLPPLPKDRLFAEMLKEHEAQIYKYHEHDSLLENKEEETLSEEERRAAWEDFENEKTRPPPQPFLSPYAMHNGMVQGLLAQQQQMAMATISAMLRKDMPNMSDQQLRETVPLILASNPGLMQKMSEIYKYAQPGMMNPGMMNPMNAGSGMSGGSGMGASALHYEPPWQRQQQQQQQMRLQQLMQHQNSMGAKYYAGGLGSRDPMAMALQQQRARELMHRPRARGRPPLASAAPRPPPAHATSSVGDVVNLDSD